MAARLPKVTAHVQPDGGIADAYLGSQLAGNGQSIDSLAFITSMAAGNLELLARGGAGTFVKLNYLDAGGTERTGPGRPRPPPGASSTWIRTTVR